MVHRMSKRQIQLSRRAPRTAPPSARNKVPARQRGTAITASKLCVAVDVDEGECALTMLARPNVLASPWRESLVVIKQTTSVVYCTLLLTMALHAVLGQFLPQLCRYCADEHDMVHTIDEFFIYEFAKVRFRSCFTQCPPGHDACKPPTCV